MGHNMGVLLGKRTGVRANAWWVQKNGPWSLMDFFPSQGHVSKVTHTCGQGQLSLHDTLWYLPICPVFLEVRKQAMGMELSAHPVSRVSSNLHTTLR